jgi:adenylate kinase family enzyme
MVVGVSAGVGKTTFSRQLGELLGKRVYHLDAYYWKPNWVEATLEEFAEAQRKIVMDPEWIIEGNYSNTWEIRTDRADTIIYLELPLRTCLYRVLKRFFTNIGQKRDDLGGGCTEKIDWTFIKFIISTYHERKNKMEMRFKEFLTTDPTRKIIQLKSKKEISHFLESLENEFSQIKVTSL